MDASAGAVGAILRRTSGYDNARLKYESLAVLGGIWGAPVPSLEAWTQMSHFAKRRHLVRVLRHGLVVTSEEAVARALSALPPEAWAVPRVEKAPGPLARSRPRIEDNASTLTITVRIQGSEIRQYDGSPLPKLSDCIGELTIPAFAVAEEEDRAVLADEVSVEILKAGSIVRCRISPSPNDNSVPPDAVFHQIPGQQLFGAFVEVVLEEPLVLRTRGGKRATLGQVACRIPAIGDRLCQSLNEAYRVISERFEPFRRSHSGNVFQEMWWQDDMAGTWAELDVLRSDYEVVPVIPPRDSGRPLLAQSELSGKQLPKVVAAADWSKYETGRAIAVAVRDKAGRYEVTRFEPSGRSEGLLERLEAEAAGGGVLLGLDFPIGLPRRYAESIHLTAFRDGLAAFGTEFFIPTDVPSLSRPFYPSSSNGGARRQVLVDALGCDHIDQLRRLCEIKTDLRRAANPLFFTLGGAQVGRAAAHGWQHLLQRRLDSISIWPFDGSLEHLLERGGMTVVEIYPTDVYSRMGLTLGTAAGGKRSDAVARAASARTVAERAASTGIRLSDSVSVELNEGCESEHRFDALVGLLGMLEVVTLEHHHREPTDPVVRAVEGWILGMVSK